MRNSRSAIRTIRQRVCTHRMWVTVVCQAYFANSGIWWWMMHKSDNQNSISGTKCKWTSLIVLICRICCCSWLSSDSDWCCIWSKHWWNFWCSESSKTSGSRDSICCLVQDSSGSLYHWWILTIQVHISHLSGLYFIFKHSGNFEFCVTHTHTVSYNVHHVSSSWVLCIEMAGLWQLWQSLLSSTPVLSFPLQVLVHLAKEVTSGPRTSC